MNTFPQEPEETKRLPVSKVEAQLHMMLAYLVEDASSVESIFTELSKIGDNYALAITPLMQSIEEYLTKAALHTDVQERRRSSEENASIYWFYQSCRHALYIFTGVVGDQGDSSFPNVNLETFGMQAWIRLLAHDIVDPEDRDVATIWLMQSFIIAHARGDIAGAEKIKIELMRRYSPETIQLLQKRVTGYEEKRQKERNVELGYFASDLALLREKVAGDSALAEIQEALDWFEATFSMDVFFNQLQTIDRRLIEKHTQLLQDLARCMQQMCTMR